MDAMVVTGPQDCFYLSGFRATGDHVTYPVLVVPDAGDPVLYVSALDEEVAQREVALPVETPADGFAAAVRDRLPAEADVAVTGQMSVGLYHRLGGDITLHIDDGILSEMRAVKAPDEVDAISDAYDIVEDAVGAAVTADVAGETERAVAAEIEYEMRVGGGDETAFPTIVGTGAFTALPHHVATDTTIEEGPLLVDAGVRANGYRSDFSRVFHVGEPSDAFLAVYQAVRRAQEAAADRLAAGVAYSDVARAARDVIEEAGYGDSFPHSAGHGVGIDIHEAPNLSTAADGALKAGMVVTVEPGVYLRGEYGVRIEDAYHVTEDGAERLTATSRDLTIL